MALDNSYLKEIQKQLGYFGAWSPDTTYAIGDYGNMDGKQFEKLGNIKKWIEPKTRGEGGTEQIYYTSAGDVNVKSTIGAKDTTGKVQVDVEISFAKENSIFFLAQNVTTVSTANIGAVGDKIVDVYKRSGNDWKLSYVWIAEIKQAAYLKVIISQSSNARIKLSGKAPVVVSGVPVANIDFSALMTKSKNAVSEFQGTNKTPLLRFYEVKDPITKKAFYTEYK